MLGDVLLRRADGPGQLLHSRFALTKPIEELDPRRLAQGPEALCDELDEIVGKRLRSESCSLLLSSG